jgi:hypothetical protein
MRDYVDVLDLAPSVRALSYPTLDLARVPLVALDRHPKLSSSLGELAINSQVEVLTLAVIIVTFIGSTSK